MNEKDEPLFRLEAAKVALNLVSVNAGFPKAKPTDVDGLLEISRTIFRYIKMGTTVAK